MRDTALLVDDTARGFSGRLTIGLTETASFATPVAALVTQPHKQWLDVELSLLQAQTNRLVGDLIEPQIDVAFVRSSAPGIAAVQCRPFLTEGIVVVAPKMPRSRHSD